MTCSAFWTPCRRDSRWPSTPTWPRLAEIAENDFNLNIPRYVDTFEEEAEIDLMAVRREREQLKAELAQLEAQMDVYLKELGYE